MQDNSNANKPLKVVHVIASIGENTGGTATAVVDLLTNLAGNDVNLELCTIDMGPAAGKPLELDRSTISVHEASAHGCRRLRLYWSKRFTSMLREVCRDADIIHSHGMWMTTVGQATKVANELGIPRVHSPHGMLEPWALSRSAWKKKLAWFMFAGKAVRTAACIDAKAVLEAQNIENLGFGNPICVTPIGLNVDEYLTEPSCDTVEQEWPQLRDKRTLLFLSRIHPKKGLIGLARVWGRLADQFPDWHLVIAGPDEANHQSEVEHELSACGVRDRTTFTGSVSGLMKTNIFAGCDVFVLPTYSENFGIVVPEALASGKPVITTVGTPWVQLTEANCGWRIELGEQYLEAALLEAMSMSESERHEMGIRGRQLVRDRFDWGSIAQQTLAMYNWVLDKGPKPSCVAFDNSTSNATGINAK